MKPTLHDTKIQCCPFHKNSVRDTKVCTSAPIQEVLPICQTEFIVSEVNSESEQVSGPKPWNAQLHLTSEN